MSNGSLFFSISKPPTLGEYFNLLPHKVRSHSMRVGIYMQMIMEAADLRFIDSYTDLKQDDIYTLARDCGYYHDLGKAVDDNENRQRFVRSESRQTSERVAHRPEVNIQTNAPTNTPTNTPTDALTNTPTDVEKEHHSVSGAEIILPFGRSALTLEESRYWGEICDVCAYHHENYDGSGEPFGLRGTDIPFMARVCRVADYYEHLVQRKPINIEAFMRAMMRIETHEGTYFDPLVISCLYKSRERIIDFTSKRSKSDK